MSVCVSRLYDPFMYLFLILWETEKNERKDKSEATFKHIYWELQHLCEQHVI